MSTDLDTARIVRTWLRAARDDSADRIVDTVLDMLDSTPQRRSVVLARASRSRTSYARLAIAAAVVVAAAVGINLLRAGGAGRGSTPVVPPSSAATPTPSPVATPARDPADGSGRGTIEPGGYDLPWPMGPSDARIHVTVPAGWSWAGLGTTIYEGQNRFVYGGPVDLTAHGVSRVVTSVCAADASSTEIGPSLIEPGPTVDDLTTAITNVVGTLWSGPADMLVGGYPAKRLVTVFSSADCPGPARRWIWFGPTEAFALEDGVRTTIYVVDVNGDRLVLSTSERDATPDEIARLENIVGSIIIERPPGSGGTTPTPSPSQTPPGLFPVSAGPDGDLRIGRHAAIVDGVPFSFHVPAGGWEPQLGFSVNKSTHGPQGAEAIVRWTTFPSSVYVDPCPGLLGESIGRSAGELAAAMVATPGVAVVSGPTDLRVGGRPAKRVVLTVRDEVGCQPGFFYTYDPLMGGALWTATNVGDTITVWLVDVAGTLLFIEGEAHEDAGVPVVEQMHQIVDSIQFGP